MNTLISIVIPVYNAEKHLPRCLDSVLAQTYKPIEIVLVNDGSKDESLAICRRYADRHEQIVVIDQKNRGPAVARKAGFDASKGESIMFVDADDTIRADMCDILIEAMHQDDADVVQCGFTQMDDEGKEVRKQGPLEKRIIELDERFTACAREEVPLLPWGKLIKRVCLSHVDFSELRYGEDHWLIVQLGACAQRIMLIPQQLYFYHQGPYGITQSAFTPGKFDSLKAWMLIHNLYERQAPFALPFARRRICGIALNLYAAASRCDLPEKEELLDRARSTYDCYYRRSDYDIAVSGIHSSLKNLLFHLSPRFCAALINTKLWKRLKTFAVKYCRFTGIQGEGMKCPRLPRKPIRLRARANGDRCAKNTKWTKDDGL